jgi:hypothetical protein
MDWLIDKNSSRRTPYVNLCQIPLLLAIENNLSPLFSLVALYEQ